MPPKGPRIFDGNSTTTSRVVQQYARKYPAGFLDFLQVAWERDGAEALKNPSLISELKATQVLCEGGEKRPLSETYLPSRELVFIHRRYMVEDESFPFIKFPGPLTPDEVHGRWAFLQLHLGVGAKDSLDFYLEILISICRQSGRSVLEFPRRILDLYRRIDDVCAASDNEAETRDKVR
jgi:hypothetical protein